MALLPPSHAGRFASATAALSPLTLWWRSLPLRERRLMLLAATLLGAFVLWTVAVRPALDTLQRAPAEQQRLDAQLQAMQILAAEVRELRATAAVPPDVAAQALQGATQRLGDGARLLLQADRATLTLTDIRSTALRDWLLEARSAARARPLEAELVRGENGYSGRIVLALGGAG
jgi:general secretion pathway protein M